MADSLDLENARIVHELRRTGNGPDPFSAAVRSTRMPMLITDPNQPDNPVVFVNAAFLKLTGYDRSEVIGRNCRFLQGPGTNRDDVARLRQAIAVREPVELDVLNYRKDGSTFWNRVLVSPVCSDDGELTYYFASQFDVTTERERLSRLEKDRVELETVVAQRDAELIASEQRLQIALKAGRMGSWSLDVQSERLIASDGCKENFGRPASDPFSYEELMAAVHPDDRARRDDAVQTAIATGAPLDVEYRLLTPEGEERWVQVRGQANYRADGTPLSLVGVSQDVTDRKLADEHRELLAKELNHRVKNGLAMVQSLIVQTIRRAGSLEEAGETLQARVLAMSAANDLLLDQRMEGAWLCDLLKSALAPFGIKEGEQFELCGADVKLPPGIAASFALGMHELATNAAKYGALSCEGGIVHLDWAVDNSLALPHLRFTWTERGGPPVSAPTETGFGTKLIRRVLASKTGGAAHVDYRRDGLVLMVHIPLTDTNQTAGAE